MRDPEQPRISPGGPREVGRVTWVLLRLAARKTGGPLPNVITTLARHRGLFLPWLLYSSRLMPYGSLQAAESELVIVRVAVRTGSDYERHHHELLAAQAGLQPAMLAWLVHEPGAGEPAPQGAGMESAHAELLVRAADELLDDRDLSDATWTALRERFDERRCTELCLLVGHYAGLAATLKALRVQIEPGAGMHSLR